MRNIPDALRPKKLRRVHPERGKKQKKAKNDQPKDGRERGGGGVMQKNLLQGTAVGKNA